MKNVCESNPELPQRRPRFQATAVPQAERPTCVRLRQGAWQHSRAIDGPYEPRRVYLSLLRRQIRADSATFHLAFARPSRLLTLVVGTVSMIAATRRLRCAGGSHVALPTPMRNMRTASKHRMDGQQERHQVAQQRLHKSPRLPRSSLCLSVATSSKLAEKPAKPHQSAATMLHLTGSEFNVRQQVQFRPRRKMPCVGFDGLRLTLAGRANSE